MADATTSLRAELARRTGTDASDWFLTLRARHGMQVVLEALRDERGEGEVVTQLLTCCTAVDPILASGMRPRYADVSHDTLSVDPARADVSADTRAVVLQHTFGLMDPVADGALRQAAGDALLLEDCAHCVARLSRDAEGAPVADVSIHSFGVEKLLPTYFGGAVWVNPAMRDQALRQAILSRLGALPELDGRTAQAARAYHNQIRLLLRLPRPLSRRVRARLEGEGRFLPAVSEEELRGRVSHAPARASEWIAAQALAALAGIDPRLEQRTQAAEAYGGLISDGLALVPRVAREVPQPLLHFPVYLREPEQARRLLRRVSELGLYAVPWYAPTLFPGVRDEAAYGVPADLDGLPVTRELSVAPVGLPCDVTPDQARAVVGALADVVGQRR